MKHAGARAFRFAKRVEKICELGIHRKITPCPERAIVSLRNPSTRRAVSGKPARRRARARYSTGTTGQ